MIKELFKQRLGTNITHLTVLLFLYISNVPKQLLFGYTIMSFSPIWIQFLKFFIAIIKNNPNVVIPYLITYGVALFYYFYTYGFNIISILYLLYGITLMICAIVTYNLTYSYLEDEGIKEYRWKALLSYTTSTTFSIILAILIKLLLSF